MLKESNLEIGGFLDGQNSESEFNLAIPDNHKKEDKLSRHGVLLIMGYSILLFLYIFLYRRYYLRNCSNPISMEDLFPSIDKAGVIQYERRTFPAKIRGNPFAGEPSPQLDSAWHDLFEDIRIRVTTADLEYFNLTSLKLADGSGYAAELGVHHELHCLKKIRHWIYKDYYLSEETEEELVEWRSHIHHCLEIMREAIMCRADTSLSTFKWLPGGPPRLTAVALGHHKCVDWDALMKWVRQNSVSIFEPGVLESPAFD